MLRRASVRCCGKKNKRPFLIPRVPIGQPTPHSHPHLFSSDKNTTTETTTVSPDEQVIPGFSYLEFEERRHRLYETLPTNSISVFCAKGEAVRNCNNIFFPFRQDSDFMYLTGCCEPCCVAIFSKDKTDQRAFALFVREKSPHIEMWHGSMAGTQCASMFFRPDLCFPLAYSTFYLRRLLMQNQSFDDPTVFLQHPKMITPLDVDEPLSFLIDAKKREVQKKEDEGKEGDNGSSDALEHVMKRYHDPFHAIAQTLADTGKVVFAPSFRRMYRFPNNNTETTTSDVKTIKDTLPIMRQVRCTKTEAEINVLRRGAETTRKAFIAGMQATAPGRSEWDIFNAMERTVREDGCESLAYIPVIASGTSALSLHYVSNRQILKPGQLINVDAGADTQGYATDCTRAWPVSGTFSEGQRILYKALLQVQERLIDECCYAGNNFGDVQVYTVKLIHNMLVDLGIMNPEGSGKPNSNPNFVTKLFPHSFGHFLGLDLHEYVSHTQRFEAGMVHTVEPGVYIPDVDELRRQQQYCDDPSAFYSSSTSCGLTGGEQQQQQPKLQPINYDFFHRWKGMDLDAIPPMFRGIGLRIEDNVVIQPSTAPGGVEKRRPEVLTIGIPKTVEEIEAIMKDNGRGGAA